MKPNITIKQNITVAYQNLDIVEAGDDTNHIVIKNNGQYKGGSNLDIFFFK